MDYKGELTMIIRHEQAVTPGGDRQRQGFSLRYTSCRPRRGPDAALAPWRHPRLLPSGKLTSWAMGNPL